MYPVLVIMNSADLIFNNIVKNYVIYKSSQIRDFKHRGLLTLYPVHLTPLL